jgi:hypothetical protein
MLQCSYNFGTGALRNWDRDTPVLGQLFFGRWALRPKQSVKSAKIVKLATLGCLGLNQVAANGPACVCTLNFIKSLNLINSLNSVKTAIFGDWNI